MNAIIVHLIRFISNLTMELCEATEENPFVHGMSRSFVNSLQQLFIVLDSSQSGTIRFHDLAAMWASEDEEEDDDDNRKSKEDNEATLLPKGLMNCLARVTLPNGLLTFDRFCAGIKLCLLKNQVEANAATDQQKDDLNDNENSVVVLPNSSLQHERPSSEPQMLAPPPPPTAITPNYINEDHNNNNSNPSAVNMTFFNFTNGTCSGGGDESSSSMQSISKKLPLPSYDQVMANKLQSSPEEKGHSGAKINQSMNGLQVKPIPPTMMMNNQRMLSKQMLMASSFYENFYPVTNLPKDMNNAEHHRAKSMNNLDKISSQMLQQQQQQQLQPPQRQYQNQANLQSNPELTTIINNKNKMLEELQQKQSASVNNSSPKQEQQLAPATPRTLTRNCIMKTLQNWRDHIMSNNSTTINNKELAVCKNVSVTEVNGMMPNGNNLRVMDVPQGLSLRKNVPKRREPRRHTVGADGIDLYTVRRFQQLQQEKDIIQRGLVELDKTRDWYLRQLATIQEKLIFAGRGGVLFANDCNIDAQQERIKFQAARIHYLNQHLIALREAALTFPLHMNLAIRPINGIPKLPAPLPADPNQPKQLVVNPNLVNKLKEQNRLLTEEICQKSDRITQLEREKSALIRELFQARTYNSYYNSEFDDTCM